MKFGIINSFRTFCFRLQQCISLGNIEVSSNVCIERLNNLPDEIAILHIIFAEHEQHQKCSLSRFLLFRFTMLKIEHWRMKIRPLPSTRKWFLFLYDFPSYKCSPQSYQFLLVHLSFSFFLVFGIQKN